MMKTVVAHLADSFFPPSETFIYNLICRGSQFQPVCIAQRLVLSSQFPFPAEDLYETVGPARSPKGLFSRLLAKGAGVDVKAHRIIAQRRARILHAHFGPAAVRALALKRSLRLPLVTSFYGYDAAKAPTVRAMRAGYEALFQSGDLFLAEGPALKRRLTALGCPEERIAIQRIGIPLEEIAFRLRQPKGEAEPVVVLFAGRFVEKKGISDALEAVAAAIRSGRRIEFRLAGDGPLMSETRDRIRTLGMGEAARLLGFLSYEEYLSELGRADIFIHPSKTAPDGDGEGGAPTSVLEAQASGLPVLSTTHDDIPNVVHEGRSALLSPPGDVAGLTANLSRLLDHPVLWAEMGEAGRAFVERHHDLGRQAIALESLYGEVLGRNP